MFWDIAREGTSQLEHKASELINLANFNMCFKSMCKYTEKHFIWQKTWVVAESLYIRTAKNILTTETLCSQKV